MSYKISVVLFAGTAIVLQSLIEWLDYLLTSERVSTAILIFLVLSIGWFIVQRLWPALVSAIAKSGVYIDKWIDAWQAGQNDIARDEISLRREELEAQKERDLRLWNEVKAQTNSLNDLHTNQVQTMHQMNTVSETLSIVLVAMANQEDREKLQEKLSGLIANDLQ